MLVSNKVELKLKLIQLLRIVVIVGLSLIIVQTIFFPNAFFGSKIGLSTFNIIIGSLIIISLIFLIYKYMGRLSAGKQRWLLISLMILWLVIQLFLDFTIQGAQGVDDFDVRLQAHSLAAGNTTWASYFYTWPNNVNIAILFSWFIQFFQLFGLNNSWLLFNISITVITFSTLLIGTKIIHNFVNFKSEIILWLLILLYTPYYVINFYSYTDPIAVFFVVMSFFEITRMQQKSRWNLVHLFCGIILITLGTLFKTNAVIFAIAIPIYIFLKFDWKKLVQSFLLLMIVMGLGVMVQKEVQNHYHYTEKDEFKFPTEYWIALSYNKYSKGTVNSDKYTWAYTGLVEGYENKKELDQKLIKDEIKTLGWKGVFKQYLDKTNVMYSAGSTGTLMRDFKISPHYSKLTTYLSGTNGYLAAYLAQIVYLVILLLVLYQISYVFIKKSQPTVFDLFLIFFFGLYLFHILLWEVENRYLYLTIPLLFVFAVLPLEHIKVDNLLAQVGHYSKQQKWLLTVIITTLAGFMVVNNFDLLDLESEAYVPVQQQEFFRTNMYRLKAQAVITQKFDLNKAPHYLKINLGSNANKFTVKVFKVGSRKNVVLGQNNGFYELKPNQGKLIIEVSNKTKKTQAVDVNKIGYFKMAQYPAKINHRQSADIYLNEGFYSDKIHPVPKKIYFLISLMFGMVMLGLIVKLWI